MPVYKRMYGKRGDKHGVWWYGFWWNGERIQKSSGVKVRPKTTVQDIDGRPVRRTSRQIAQDMEAAERMRLKERENRAGTLGCEAKDLACCVKCAQLFNGAGAVALENLTFCGESCRDAWTKEHRNTPTLRGFAQRFLDNAGYGRRKAPRESTVMFYAECLKQILQHEPLAGAKLDAITPELVERFVKSRKAGLSPSRVNGLLRTLRRCLQVALDMDLIAKVPKITLLQGEGERDFVLSPEQETVYLSTCPQPLADIAVFLLGTGLRLGEACGLEWKQVSLEAVRGYPFGFVRVAEGKSKNAKRDVRLTSRVQEMLKRRRESRRSIWVFGNGDGSGPLSKSTVCHQHIERRRLLKMPKDFVIHGFRHTMLTRLAAAGADVFWIKKLAGHCSIVISEKYVHPGSESLDVPFGRFEAMGPKALPEGPKTAKAATVSATVLDGQETASQEVI
jgi:integrase